MSETILIWYRNDLRLHDHEPIYRALQQRAQVVPLYCFDPRAFGRTPHGFAKTGAHRARFLLQSVAALKDALEQLGSGLVVRLGEPEAVIPALVKELNISAVYYHQEVTSEERAVESALEIALKPLNVALRAFWGTTLFHLEDLPFDVAQLPELFTDFRKRVEESPTVREALPAPGQLSKLPEVDPGALPTLATWGLEEPATDPRQVIEFTGGEPAGLARLDHYFWQANLLKNYKQTRNGMLGGDYSSKFSPWLAHGCLSPRRIYEQVRLYESQRLKNDSTYWLIFELLWRDFFRLVALKHGNRLFRASGLRGLVIDWQDDPERFERWRTGQTGFPLVDANLRELAATGYMSNRGRQNVASFLTKNLGIDWRQGAEWFESQLIDYDVTSNWGNWNYTAGVGNDARGFRFFNILKQARDYDPEGDYVKHWLPELAHVPAPKIHEPWKLLPVEQQRFGVRLGVDYPLPMVDLFQSAAANEALYNAAGERRAGRRRRAGR
ncbi:DASH family cryptochrome [Gloeobacter kilaueensis]|uniref:Cryptochrome DASH n=1 Tax=Gloeobacter kilaueensis (strain ATCC BAA-2537 / CCAP 1431/1 / ULC 316 / JS1) TaxID=1183438 RepID=U5QGD6_GLOK1|nr:DASH family cryptochrome [Gloeobacter kilaueensis]AGY58032.1 deoxyribodipyrimidine photolyase [Gloeobacter kilaueensis JS1]